MVPRTAPIIAGFLALVIAFAVRSLARLLEDHGLRPAIERSEAVVVFGAGNAGRQIVRTMLRAPDSPYRPVALLDDDPQKSRLRIEGLHVVGTRRDIVAVAHEYGAASVLIAIPSASGSASASSPTRCSTRASSVLVLPPVAKLFGIVALSDIRPVTIDDLLGRRPADIDTAAIAGYVRGRRVLVTGAGGSIGSELCRQLHRYRPAVARHARPRRVGTARRAAVDPRAGAARLAEPRPRRHPRPRPGLPGLRATPPGGRVPRRRAQAPTAARDVSRRGVEDQRRRHPPRPRSGRKRSASVVS